MRILLLPGWLDSGPGHWQTRWEALHGDVRVAQSDWLWPKRGDWMARLEEVLLECDTPALLAAHSLGSTWWPPGPRTPDTARGCRARCWWRRPTPSVRTCCPT